MAVKSFGLGLRRWGCETARCSVLFCATWHGMSGFTLAGQAAYTTVNILDYIKPVAWAICCKLLSVWWLYSEGTCMAEVHLERWIFHLENNFVLMRKYAKAAVTYTKHLDISNSVMLLVEETGLSKLFVWNFLVKLVRKIWMFFLRN